jgi:hypothetical protein
LTIDNNQSFDYFCVMTTQPSPYMTATGAARELGYTHSSYLSSRCRLGKIPGAYRDGGTWLIPAQWVADKKAEDAAFGIKRGRKPGRPVTTGKGLNRNRKSRA